MATVVNFGGKRIIEPGAYAKVESGIPASPGAFSFGNVCIIDTGSGANWGGGSGISGQFSEGINSLYSFNDLNDFQDFIRGGLIWDLAPFIFNPLVGQSGPQTVSIIRACETTSAEIEFAFSGGGFNGGIINFICKNEGKGGNGYLDEKLAKGKVSILSPVAISDEFQLFVDEGGGDVAISSVVVATTTSPADFMSLIVNSINSNSAGYTAKIQSGEVIVTAKRRTGASANSFVLSAVSDPSAVLTQFSGGVDGTKISVGYGAKMRVASNDNTKFQIDFFEGGYKGETPFGNHYSNLNPQESSQILISTSVEFSNIDDLIQWAKTDSTFKSRFELKDNWVINGSGLVDSTDLNSYSDFVLASGGNEIYNNTQLDKVLSAITELDNTFFLCDKWGDEAKGVENTKIFEHIKNSAEFNKFMIVGGGIDDTKFEGSNGSIGIAEHYNDVSVIVVHSGHKREMSGNIEKLPAIYHAANIVGRLGGLEPQTPLTFKAISISNFNHTLTQKQRELALQKGVIHNRLVPGIGNVVNQGINTIQKNTQLINPDGSSFEISVMRIAAQLNKELSLNLRPLFVGKNRSTASPADVKVFVESYLASKTATTLSDNLIISSKNVTVKLKDDFYEIRYGFVPNGPINKLFATGFMLDANLSA
jgi:hypothetical protein